MTTSSKRRLAAALGAACLALALAYSWMFSDITVPNERSRVYLTVALVDCGTLDIDCAVDRFGPVNDWARANGHYYTDKAPGSSFLGAVPYAIARLFSEPGDWTIAGLINLQRRFLMIPLALLGALIFWRLLRRLGVSNETSAVALGVWLLGSTALHYASAFYGHQIVSVALLAGVYWGLVVPWRDDRAWLEPNALLAGVACGVAGLVEYQALPLSLIVALGVAHRAWRGGRPTQVTALVLGALPFAVAFLAYHAAAFGGPLELSYKHLVSEAIQAHHARGVGGVGLPRWEAVHGTLVSLHRGLLAVAPIFVLAPVGLYLLARRERRLAVTAACAIGVGMLVAFGADVWFGGWSFGPRLLVPVLGLAMVGVALALEHLAQRRSSWVAGLVWGAIAVGVFYNQLVQAVFPELPEDALNPLRDVVGPMLARDQLSPNLVSALTGARGPWTLAPLLVLLVVGLAWAARLLHGRARTGRAWLAWGAAALVVPALFTVYVALRPPSWSPAQQASWTALIDHWERVEAQR